jgi:hypothetical protein
MIFQLVLIVLAFVMGLLFSEYVIPLVSKNILHRKELLGVKISSMAQLPGADSRLGKYELGIENKSKIFDFEDIYVSMDFPFVVENVRTSADQGVVAPQLSQGSTPMIFHNSQATSIPTNHLNMAARSIGPSGLFAVSVFVNKKPQSAAAPFTGFNPQAVEGKVVYSYTFWGSRIKRKMCFKIPPLQES